MNVRIRGLVFAFASAVLCACTQTGTSLPAQNAVDPVASNSLQFTVGVATIANQGTSNPGLNVVETLRQADGLSGTLFNVPAITGPAGFSISATTVSSKTSPPLTTLARADYGTDRITQQSFDTQQATGYNQTLPYATTGAFGYGLCPCNSNSGPLNGVPQLYHAYYQPFYSFVEFGNLKTGQFLSNLQYYGGPPAFPAASPEAAAAGFNGYSIGFTDFAVQPVVGAYRLDVALPPDFAPGGNTPTPAPTSSPEPVLSATARLKSVQGLPLFPTPQFASDGNGGGTITLQIPSGVTETLAFIQEGEPNVSFCFGNTTPLYYTFFVRGSGTHSVTVPDSIGPANSQTLCLNAPYFVYAAGFDYPAYEAAYPQSTSQTPAIANGANGQADVTTSEVFTGIYQ